MAKFQFYFDDRIYRISDPDRLMILIERKFKDVLKKINITFAGSDLDIKSDFYNVYGRFINRFTGNKYWKKVGTIDELFIEVET